MARRNKNLSGTQITDEVIKRTSSTSLGLGHDTIMATGFEIRTGAGGTGTKLTLTTDYTLGSEDSALSTEAGYTIYTKVAIVNGAYHSIDLYVSYKTVGDYAKSEYAIQEFGEDAIGKWAKLSNGEKIYAGAGIIESGSNSNGSWVKYGDGTYKQYVRRMVALSAATGISGFPSYGVVSGQCPLDLYIGYMNPIVTIGGFGANALACTHLEVLTGAGAYTFVSFSNSAPGADTEFVSMEITGRWRN